MPGLDWRLRLGTNTFELEEALVPIAHYLQHEVGWEKIIAQEVVLQETLLNYLRRRPQHFRIFGEKSSDPEKRVSVITFEVIGRSCNDVTNQICRKGRFRVVSGKCWAPRPTHDVLKLSYASVLFTTTLLLRCTNGSMGNSFDFRHELCDDLVGAVVS